MSGIDLASLMCVIVNCTCLMINVDRHYSIGAIMNVVATVLLIIGEVVQEVQNG